MNIFILEPSAADYNGHARLDAVNAALNGDNIIARNERSEVIPYRFLSRVKASISYKNINGILTRVKSVARSFVAD